MHNLSTVHFNLVVVSQQVADYNSFGNTYLVVHNVNVEYFKTYEHIVKCLSLS